LLSAAGISYFHSFVVADDGKKVESPVCRLASCI
jgi:hypothetical protein